MKIYIFLFSAVLIGCMGNVKDQPNFKGMDPNMASSSYGNNNDSLQDPKQDNKQENKQDDDAWQKRLEDAKKDLMSKGEQDKDQADSHYDLSERYFKEGKLDLAETECDKALNLNPRHAGAMALKQQILFMTNRVKINIPKDVVEKERTKRGQIYLEISNALEDGYRKYNLGDYDNAEKQFNLVILYTRQFPDDIEVQILNKKAWQMMYAVKDAKRQKEIDQRLLIRRRLEEQKRREELEMMLEEQKSIKVLLEKARLHFEKLDYDNTIKMCEKILEINPGLVRVRELQDITEKFRFENKETELLELFVEEWKKNFRDIERMLVIYDENQIIFFPSKEEWEKISKREAPVIKPVERVDFKSKEVLAALRTLRIDVDFQGIPLQEVLKQLQITTNLNFAIDKGVDKSTPITAKGTRTSVDKFLEIALGITAPPGLDYYVEDGIIFIATPATVLKRKLEDRIYPIEDLIYIPPNFPGNIFDPFSFNFAPPNRPAAQGIDENKLVEWILRFIDPTANTDPKSIRAQNRLLFVRNTREMHQKIEQFLKDFAEVMQVLVSVEARFVAIEHSYVKRFGIELANLDGAPLNPWSRIPAGHQIHTVDEIPVGVAGHGGLRLHRDWGLAAVNALQVAAFQSAAGPDAENRLEYTLVDDVIVNAIIRMVSKNKKGYIVTAPRLTLYNDQESNQFIGRTTPFNSPNFVLGMQPGPGTFGSGVSFNVHPVVSADRKYVRINMSLSMSRTSARTVDFQLPPPPPPPPNPFFPGPPPTPPPSQAIRFDLPSSEFVTLRTTAIVPDQGTLIVGGFSVIIDVDAESSIPIWRAVPILGIVGTDQLDGKERHRLIVIIKAKIIVPSDEEKKKFGKN